MSGQLFSSLSLRADLAWLICFIGVLSISLTTSHARPDSSRYYAYDFALPEHDSGYWLVPHPYLEPVDPGAMPELHTNRELNLFATKGEYEPASFVMYATEDLENVELEVTDLESGAHRISREHLTVRTVMRAPERIFYRSPPEDHVISNRFLLPPEPFDLGDGHLRQIWLTIHVPEDASAGHYSGRVRVHTADQSSSVIPITLQVFPFQLKDNPNKQYGVYYRSHTRTGDKSRELVLQELRDIRAHGGDILKPGIGIGYDQREEQWVPRYGDVREFLDLMREAGYADVPVVINTGFEWLAHSMLGHDAEELSHKEVAAWVQRSNQFQDAAIRGLEGLADLQEEYSEFKFLVTHMDEVFNQGRLPLYIALTQVAENGPDFDKYITIHTQPGTDSLRKAIDPYVDVRGHHGAHFEGWLNRGNTVEQYRRELNASGDEAWHYHNPMGGVWMTAERQRVINGLYSWINPFRARVDWIYNWYSGNPLNDLDGDPDNNWNYNYGYAFPSPDDSLTIIRTRDWAAWREGIDDQKYLYTLETLIERYEEKGRADKAARAARWLDSLRARLPNPQDVPLREGGREIRSSPPFTAATADQFDFGDYQTIRFTAAQYILELREGLR